MGNGLGRFLGVGVSELFRGQVAFEQTIEIEAGRIRFGRGFGAKPRQSSDIQPESGAFRALVHFVTEFQAETVPVQQGMDAFRAGMLNVPENVDAGCAFHVEQFRAGGGVTLLQFFDGAPLEPQAAATARAHLHLDAGDIQ